MRLTSLELILVASLSSACTPRETGDSETDAEPTTAEPTTAASPTTTSEPTTAAEPGETEGATEGDDTDTGGSPAACEDPADPPVSAAFSIEGPGWIDPVSADIDVPCVITSVVVEAGAVRSELACDVEGAPQTAVFQIPAAPEGDVAWDVDQSVRLRVRAEVDEMFSVAYTLVRLAGADESLLAAAGSGGVDHGFGGFFAPLRYTVVPVCGMVEGRPAAIEFAAPEGPKVEVFSGDRDVLPIDAQEVFAIEVGRVEIGACCHAGEEQEVVLRRVRLGG